jgi:hypothetical protein
MHAPLCDVPLNRASIRAAAPALALVFAIVLSGCGRQKDSEPSTFDPDSVPDAYRYSTAVLAWPGASRAYQVTPGGDLWNGEWKARIRPSAGGAPADSPRVIAYEERWRPIAHWTRRSGTVRWEFQAAAFGESGAPGVRIPRGDRSAPRDSGLVVVLEVRATNAGSSPSDASLALTLDPGDSLEAFFAFDGPPSPSDYRWAHGSSRDPAHGWSSIPVVGPTAATTWSLAPGTSRSASFILPAYPLPERTLAAWGGTPAVTLFARAREHWNDEVAHAATFALDDPEVERAIRSALVLMLCCRERRGSDWVPIAGPLHYRDVWLRDGARAIQALTFLGRIADARALAEGFLAFQWPQGAFMSQRAQLDGTGQALWAFDQALMRPAPSPEVSRFAECAYWAWAWCEWQRDVGRESKWPFGAMLPYADPHDDELVAAQLVGNDAWAIAGYRAAERLLRAAGRGATADSVADSRVRYVREFEAALERSGSPDLPPSWQRVGRDWGNLGVAYPCGVLPASDPRCARLAERVWNRSGGAGLCSYAHVDSAHAYLGADLGTWALLSGRPAEWERVLDATLEWRSASGGAAELFSRSTRDYGSNPPPHATAAAALVALVRNALVFDEDDTLRLTLGGRASWWKGSAIHGLPTRWGTLDLTFARRGAEAEWTWSPVPVWTSLTLPPGTRLAAAPSSGLTRATETRVLAPPGTRTASVKIVAADEAAP